MIWLVVQSITTHGDTDIHTYYYQKGQYKIVNNILYDKLLQTFLEIAETTSLIKLDSTSLLYIDSIDRI